jgi:hypothetical protein
MRKQLVLVAALAAASCTSAQIAANTARVVAAGQLFCSKATADGPLVVALATATGVPVIVTGATSAAVAAACASIGAVPVPPPLNAGTVPTLLSPTMTAPLPVAPSS